MKKLITLALLLFNNQAAAVFTAYAVITPESQSKYEIKIESKVTSNGKCTLKFDAIGYPDQHAWLILTSKKASHEEQKLRSYIWGESSAPSNLILKTKLNPAVYEVITRKNIKDTYYEVTLKNKIKHSAYIYIDFPRAVFDGGYYYSIDVGAYCG